MFTEEYQAVFAEIRQELNENPEVFLTDTVAWIESTLRRAGAGILNPQTAVQPARIAEQPVVSSNPQLDISKSYAQEAYVAAQNEHARHSLNRHIPRADGSVVVVSSDIQTTTSVYTRRWNWLLYSSHAFYAYTLITGTLPLTLTLGYPFLAYYRIFR